MSEPSSSLAAARPLRLETLTPGALADALQRDCRLIVPVGTIEPHGAHLPVGTDAIITERLADDLSAEFGVVRAPLLAYGVNPVLKAAPEGNAAVRKKTLHRMLNDLVDAWETSGVQEFILLTTHRYDPHQEAMATVVTRGARLRVVDCLGIPFPDLLAGQEMPLHADEVDTSLLLHLAPELVRMDLAEDYMVADDPVKRYRTGLLGVRRGHGRTMARPTIASAERGAAIYARILDRIADRIFRDPDPVE